MHWKNFASSTCFLISNPHGWGRVSFVKLKILSLVFESLLTRRRVTQSECSSTLGGCADHQNFISLPAVPAPSSLELVASLSINK